MYHVLEKGSCKGSKETVYVRSYLPYVIMSSEVKLMYQSDIEINVNTGNFKLNFGDKNQDGKKKNSYQRMTNLS